MTTEALSSDLEDAGLYPVGEVFNYFFFPKMQLHWYFKCTHLIELSCVYITNVTSNS